IIFFPFIHLDANVQLVLAVIISGIGNDGSIPVTEGIIVIQYLILIALIFFLIEFCGTEQLEPEIGIDEFSGPRKRQESPVVNIVFESNRLIHAVRSGIFRRKK